LLAPAAAPAPAPQRSSTALQPSNHGPAPAQAPEEDSEEGCACPLRPLARLLEHMRGAGLRGSFLGPVLASLLRCVMQLPAHLVGTRKRLLAALAELRKAVPASQAAPVADAVLAVPGLASFLVGWISRLVGAPLLASTDPIVLPDPGLEAALALAADLAERKAFSLEELMEMNLMGLIRQLPAIMAGGFQEEPQESGATVHCQSLQLLRAALRAGAPRHIVGAYFGDGLAHVCTVG
jgi:hypothetical protein